jgi:hypothetical protein
MKYYEPRTFPRPPVLRPTTAGHSAIPSVAAAPSAAVGAWKPPAVMPSTEVLNALRTDIAAVAARVTLLESREPPAKP